MDTKEYSNLLPQDSESILGASEDGNRQWLCSSCSEDIASVPEKKRLFGSKASPLMYILLILLLTSNLGVIALWWKTKPTFTDCVRPLLAYSPAKAAGAYHYEKRRLVSETDANVYTGAPRLAHDAAWARLLQPITIKISKEELELVGEDSIALADGSGYLAEPSVYHELHCLKRVRRHKYLDYYYPNMTEEQRYREGLHYDHCLEYWREAAMCRGDTSLATFYWRGDEPVSHVYSERECVNWEALDKWARTRMVNMTDRSILQH